MKIILILIVIENIVNSKISIIFLFKYDTFCCTDCILQGICNLGITIDGLIQGRNLVCTIHRSINLP